MKNQFTIVIIVISLLLVTSAHSQISNLTNTSTPTTEYVGWDGNTILGTAKHLDIANNYGSYNINFSTFNGSLLQRMTILNTGEVGIGDGLTPTSLLHTWTNAAKTGNYTGNFFENLATLASGTFTKIGLHVKSTGTWTGTNAINIGLDVEVSGGNINYSALFSGGNVGIGTTTPSSLLHLNVGSTFVNSQFTNTATGNGGGDGLLVGIDEYGYARINQLEPLAMKFYTNGFNYQRMIIDGTTGKVGIGLNHLLVGNDILESV